MEANNMKASNGLKIGVASVVVGMFVACIGMISMSVKPVTIHQEVLRNDLGRVEDQAKEALRDHMALNAHTGAEGELKTVMVHFKEIETQFDWLREVALLKVGALEYRVGKLEDKLENHNALREKIKHLERAVHGK
jgi:hypothetical protein